ncbi:MAG: hypothetical protein ACMUHY_09805, partial [Thermoplasmatota archaeon]
LMAISLKDFIYRVKSAQPGKPVPNPKNAFMIFVFYLIHRFYWAPQQRGEAAFGGKLMNIQQFFFKHDTAQKKVGLTGGSLGGVTAIVLVILFVISTGLGVDDLSAIAPSDTGDDTEGELDLTKYIKEDIVERDIQNLEEGGTQNYTYVSTASMIVQRLAVDLSWTDETNPPANRIRPHENTPDEFRMVITYLNETVEETAENPQDGTGTIELEVAMTDAMILNTSGEYTINVDVYMMDAGLWVPIIGPGVIGLRDSGNEYEISIAITYLISEMDVEPEPEDEISNR